MAKRKGYAYKKALEIIAYEKGEAPLPSLPKSPALRGSISSWKNKIKRGYRPKSNETKKVFNIESRKYPSIINERPFLRVNGQFHSKRAGNDIRDVIKGFSIKKSIDKERYPDLLNFNDEKLEILFGIADKLGENNNSNDWNKEFEKLGLDCEVWTSPYLIRD